MREWTDPEYAKEVGVPITTKSDLVRLLLLKKYGGVWLDGALRLVSSLCVLTSKSGRSSADDLLAFFSFFSFLPFLDTADTVPLRDLAPLARIGPTVPYAPVRAVSPSTLC